MEAQRLVKLFHPLVDDYTMQVRSTIRLVTVASACSGQFCALAGAVERFGVTGRTEINLVLNWFEELTARVPGP